MRADDPDVIEIEGPPPLVHSATTVIAALAPVVTPERRRRIEQVVAQRTDDLVVVLDSIADPHNASAVLRSADAFGVQTVHAIVGPHGFRASQGVSKGTHRWLDIVRYESAQACAERLRATGYAIYVAAMGAPDTPETLPVEAPLAVVFGNEHRGVSTEMEALADGAFSIPMRGFVESLNVSVAAAITIESLTRRSPRRFDRARREALQARFLMNSVKNADQIINDFIGHD